MTNEVTRVPTQLLARHVLAEALEVGDLQEHVQSPIRGGDHDVEYSLRDVDDWNVDTDGSEIVLSAVTEGDYQIKTARAVTNAPPSRCHPAEYESRSMPVGIVIRADWSAHDGLGEYTIEVEGL